MKTTTNMLASLLLICPGILSAQPGNDFDIKAQASNIEKRIEACPMREIVSAFGRGHHKQVWQKAAWGPPTQVFADVKANDSILYPYLLTAEFYLSFEYGAERKTKAEADADTELHRLPVQLPSAWGAKYRNVYLVSKDEIRMKSTLVLNNSVDGRSAWVERPIWSDACWDQIG